jgi:hypothetical protein
MILLIGDIQNYLKNLLQDDQAKQIRNKEVYF